MIEVSALPVFQYTGTRVIKTPVQRSARRRNQHPSNESLPAFLKIMTRVSRRASRLAAQTAVGDQVLVISRRLRVDGPPVHLDESGLDGIGAVEEPGDFGTGTQGERDGRTLVVDTGEVDGPRVDVTGTMRDRQVAARRHGGEQAGHDAVRVVGIGHVQQYAKQHYCDRLAEIQSRYGPV